MLYQTANLRLATQYRVATITLDATIIARPVLIDLDAALGIVERTPGLDVLLLRGEAAGFGTSPDLVDLAALGQRIADRIEALDAVSVAFIDGPCLAGALELALACDYRAAAGGARTRLGFMGPRAGAVPCWGGTVRLPQLIGLKPALDLFLTGRKLSAAQALAAGLIDRAFGPRMAEVHLAAYVLELQTSDALPRRRPRLLDLVPGRRSAVLRAAAARVERAFSPDQAAPRAVVRAVAAGIRGGPAAGLAAERAAFCEPDARARVGAGPKDPPPPSLARRANENPIHHVAVVGGGTIGAAVAQWAALRGCAVAVHDRDPAAVRRRLAAQFRDAVERRLRVAETVPAALDGIVCSDAWEGFTDAELVIEAVDEDRAVKQHVLAEAERRVGPAAVLATTTTAFTVRSLQEALARPERLVGLHFGCPAAALRHVEVAANRATDPSAVALVRGWLWANGREAVLVADRPGRALGRVLLPYLREAIVLADEGVPPAAIDAALCRWGMAWGPCAALDAIGLDVALATLRELATAHGPSFDPPALLTRLVVRGDLGHKTGRGFYRYGWGRPRPRWFAESVTLDEGVIVERCISRVTHAALAALGGGLVRDAATLNALVVGAGWPTFRGGPLGLMARGHRPARRPAPRRMRPARAA